MDCVVGSIVWVRRRNGSWWPGQILGPGDLSASHLTSPRSGTPVKLLGREDASVDWYNLEKSKRVKAFRCGEFDACIERAESAKGMPLKKREKYARREDAILHALELERQMLKNQGELCIASFKKGVVSSLETLGNDNEKHANSKGHVSYDNEIIGCPFPSNVANDGNRLIGEIDHSEATPRMRGLQDLGLKIASSKAKLSSSVDPIVLPKVTVDDGAQVLSSGGLCIGSALHTNGAGQIGVACRAKRSRCVYLPTESTDSFDYKEILTHVEMPSSQGEFPYHGSFVGEIESAFMDDAGSDSSETDPTGSCSDSSETEPDMVEEMTILSETGRDAEEHESTSTEEPDELAISIDMPHLYPRELITSNGTVSEWQIKGKRNNRNIVRRFVGTSDGKGFIHGTETNAERRNHLSHRRTSPSLLCYRNDFSDAFDDDDQMFGLEDEYSLTSGPVSKSQNKIHHGVDWDDWAWDDHLASRRYWDIKGFTPIYGDHYRFGGRMSSMLVNVDLKVQAGYRKEPVPIVSLMSKLDGKAIIGHPIQVEALKNGSSDILFSATDDFSNDGIGIEGNRVLQPAWRTARRTPRPHVSSSNGAELATQFPLDQEQNLEYKKLNAGSSSHKANLKRKNGVKSHRSSTDKKCFKKVPMSSSSQKTRTLSSLSIEHNLSRKPVHDSTSYRTYSFIKPEMSVPTTVACIPVQLVFSRLLEKINRPPLKTASNAALLNAGVERNS